MNKTFKRFTVFWDELKCREIKIIRRDTSDYFCQVTYKSGEDFVDEVQYQFFTEKELRKFKEV